MTRLEDKVELKFKDLFNGRDFIPLFGAPIHLGSIDGGFHYSIKNVLKQCTYTGLVCAYQSPFYVGLFYLIDRIFNLEFF